MRAIAENLVSTRRLARSSFWKRLLGLHCLAHVGAFAATQPRILEADFANDALTLRWSGTAEAYEVQAATNLGAPLWHPVLTTARTDAAIPAANAFSFFRVIDPGASLARLALAATNVITEGVQTFALQPRTGPDWPFVEPTAGNAQRTFSKSDLDKFNLLFDSQGGFTVISADGEGTGRGGRLARSAGPHPGESTFTGYLTNATRMVSFSGVGDPAPAGPLLAALLLVPGDPIVAPADRSRVLQAIGEKIAELAGSGTADSSQTLATFLAQFPELEAIGIAADSSVYAQFIDGRPVVIVNNRTGATEADLERTIDLSPLPELPSNPGTAASRQSAARTPQALSGGLVTGLPESRRAVLFQATVPGIKAAMIKSLTPAFAARGYQVSGGEASLEALLAVRNLGRDIGVFYIDSHGGVGVVPRITPSAEGSRGLFREHPTFIVMTSTAVTEAGDLAYAGHFARGELTYAFTGPDVLKDDGTIIRAIPRYCITSTFARRYWKFGRNSFVFIDTCHGGAAAAVAFPQACFDAGAAAYAGWSDAVFDGWAYYATRVLFDTMLGGNTIFDDIDPKCRPFDRAAVLAYMARRGADVDKTTNFPGARLLFTENAAGGEFGLLNPSILFMTTDESKDELTIYGLFDPSVPATVRVEGNGAVERTVQPVSATQLIVPLPGSGSPSAGRVTVRQGERPSNTIPLSEWKVSGELTRYFSAGEHEPSATYQFNVHVRTDIHPYRRFPYETPSYFSGNSALGISDSTARLVSASGVYHDPNGIRTVEWRLPSPIELPYRFVNTPDPDITYFSANASFQAGGLLYFVVNARAKDGVEWVTTTLIEGKPVESVQAFNPLTRAFSANGRNGTFSLSTGEIPAGQGSAASDSGLIKWQTAPASFPPHKSLPGYAE